MGDADLHFLSPQPDTRRSYKTTDPYPWSYCFGWCLASASHGMPIYSPAFAGTHWPTLEEWHTELALVHSSHGPRRHSCKSGTVPHGHRVPSVINCLSIVSLWCCVWEQTTLRCWAILVPFCVACLRTWKSWQLSNVYNFMCNMCSIFQTICLWIILLGYSRSL